MAAKKISRKILKISGISLGILLLLLTAFHFWFVAHAKVILENLVSSKSNGRLKLKVEKFKFSYFSTKMELENAVFFNTDTLSASTSYRFSVKKIKLNVNAVLPIIFKKQILIDSLSLDDPDIQISALKEVNDIALMPKKDFSIPEEMGKIYNSIRDALQILNVKRFEINNARFILINKTVPDQLPFIVNNIFFHINNVLIDSSGGKGKEQILFGENAVLRNRNQDIVFPDGRHRLSYSRFRINLRKRLVEFDSCTITATKTDNANTSFKVFFDTLLLTNIDFDTLYRHDVIKADSVYCLNPKFNLDVKVSKKTGANRPPPRFDQIIQQLTGDMQLEFVIVNNAGFNVNIEKDDKPSSFTSDHNNFEIQGFNVDKDAAKPLKIKSFAMAIRNYENFWRDSSFSIQFDSILFNNDRIALSNFIIRQFLPGKTVNSFNMSQFQLKGLSWEDLAFNNRLTAEEATLFRPLIDYTVIERKGQKKKENIFTTLAKMGNRIHLDKLNVEEGKINLNLKKDVQLQLQNANLSIKSRTLLHSRQISSLESSLDELQFQHGILKTNDITIELDDVHYNGFENGLQAGNIRLQSRQKTFSAVVQQVSLDSIMLDDSTESLEVNGMKWKQADIEFNIAEKENKNSAAYAYLLKNISGGNTTLNVTMPERSISASLKKVSFNSLSKRPNKKIIIEAPYAEGENLKLSDKNSSLNISNYKLEHLKKSFFQNISYSNTKKQDSANMTIPLITFVPDIISIMNGKVRANDIYISNPEADLRIIQSETSTSKKESNLPILEINNIHIQQPKIHLSQATKKGIIDLEWNGTAKKNNSLILTGINAGNEKISVSQMSLMLNHFVYTNEKGKIFNAGNGDIAAQLKNINAWQNSDQLWNWSSFAENFTAINFIIDSLGRQAGRLNIDRLKLENISLSSASFHNPGKIADNNSIIELKELTGEYNDANNHFGWFNAGFDQKNKIISVDSFAFHPTLDQDAYVASKHYQTDYLKSKTGKIIIEGVDPVLYFRDSILKIHTLSIDNLVLSDFRDTRPPFHSGIIKPLPSDLIKRIPFRISIDTLWLNHANTVYAELNNRTLGTGVISVTRMKVRMFPIKNYDLTATDTIRIQANGYLMDSIWIRLRIRESYADSLSGFLMTVRMKPARLHVLNPVFEPLSSVKIQSGYLDTLTMRAIAKDRFAYGEMKMRYHDLKIKFLNNGSEIKKGFLTGLKTFVANSFIIRNKNRSRTGRVFFLRNRERSSLNYIVKIAMSGIASSVGAKSNRKILRKYKKELKMRNLPPYDYD